MVCLVVHGGIAFIDLVQATSAGSKEQEAINFLEKKMKNDPAFTYEETVQVKGKGVFRRGFRL